jgi:hypothetical protein
MLQSEPPCRVLTLNSQTMKTYRKVDERIPVFLTSVAGGGQWLVSRSVWIILGEYNSGTTGKDDAWI